MTGKVEQEGRCWGEKCEYYAQCPKIRCWLPPKPTKFEELERDIEWEAKEFIRQQHKSEELKKFITRLAAYRQNTREREREAAEREKYPFAVVNDSGEVVERFATRHGANNWIAGNRGEGLRIIKDFLTI